MGYHDIGPFQVGGTDIGALAAKAAPVIVTSFHDIGAFQVGKTDIGALAADDSLPLLGLPNPARLMAGFP